MLIIQFHDDSFVSLISRRKKENEILIFFKMALSFLFQIEWIIFLNSNTDYIGKILLDESQTQYFFLSLSALPAQEKFEQFSTKLLLFF